jgi:hypothetical protein
VGAPAVTLARAVGLGWGPTLRTAGEVLDHARTFQQVLEQALQSELEQQSSGAPGRKVRMVTF